MKYIVQKRANANVGWQEYRIWITKKELYQNFEGFQRELNVAECVGFWFKSVSGLEYRVIKASGLGKGKEVTYEVAYAKKLFGK